MWLNEAMFGGTGGWVVKPDPELAGGLEGGGGGRERRFTGRVVGLSAREYPVPYVSWTSLVLITFFPFRVVCMQYPDRRGTNKTL